MPAGNVAEIRKYLEEVIAATNAGKMDWAQANPTTFFWTSTPPRGRLVIQRVEKTVPRRLADGRMIATKVVHYVFQALDQNGTAQFSASGEDIDDLNPLLENLYGVAETSMSRKGREFLKSILPKS